MDTKFQILAGIGAKQAAAERRADGIKNAKMVAGVGAALVSKMPSPEAQLAAGILGVFAGSDIDKGSVVQSALKMFLKK